MVDDFYEDVYLPRDSLKHSEQNSDSNAARLFSVTNIRLAKETLRR